MKFNSFSGWTPWLFSMLIIIVSVQSCQPEDPDPEIDIETGEIEEIGPTHFVTYGEIYETGINGILQHGFVWSLLPDVTLDSGDKNELGTAGPGSFSSTIRAYASDANQTKYGSEKVFETSAPTVPVLNTWAAAMNGEESSGEVPSGIQGVCPSGWHLPSEDEWKELEYHLGMTELKAKDEGWRGYEEGAWIRGLHAGRGEILHEPYEEKSGFSVRCVMDR